MTYGWTFPLCMWVLRKALPRASLMPFGVGPMLSQPNLTLLSRAKLEESWKKKNQQKKEKKLEKKKKNLIHQRHVSKREFRSSPHEKPCCCVVVPEKKGGVLPSRELAGKSPKPGLESRRDENECRLCVQVAGEDLWPAQWYEHGPWIKALLENREVVTSEPWSCGKGQGRFLYTGSKNKKKMPKVSLKHAFSDCQPWWDPTCLTSLWQQPPGCHKLHRAIITARGARRSRGVV